MIRGLRRSHILLTLLLLFPLILVACGGKSPTAAPPKAHEGPLTVVASIGPLGDFARHVGGDRVQVHVLVPPGASPHTYEPTPAQLKLLNRADVLILNGVGLEFWAPKVLDTLDNPHLKVVVASEGLQVLQTSEGERGGNPHLWLDVINATHYVARIRDAFIAVDPAGKEVYLEKSADYIETLKDLDKEILFTVDRFANKKFIAFHPAWVYFARRYGLEQAAVVEHTPGKEPSPAEIAHIVETARRIGAKAIFAEPQFSPKAAQVIAEESGIHVLFLNPLGEPPDYDYVATMRHNLAELKKGMGE